MTANNPALLSPLALAYIGDSVYDLYVRTRIIEENPELPAHELHVRAVKYVSAKGQNESVLAIEAALAEEEAAVYKRGRNAKSPSSAKNASIVEYRHATGFEAVLGYLYLKGERGRLKEIMDAAYKQIID